MELFIIQIFDVSNDVVDPAVIAQQTISRVLPQERNPVLYLSQALSESERNILILKGKIWQFIRHNIDTFSIKVFLKN